MSLHLVADLKSNYERFLSRVKESKVEWGLKFANRWAYCPSNEFDCDILLYWSDEAYAKSHAVAEWESYKPVKIDLDSFIDRWLQ